MKRLSSNQLNTQLSVIIPQNVNNALREIVNATGGTISNLVREILEDYTETRQREDAEPADFNLSGRGGDNYGSL